MGLLFMRTDGHSSFIAINHEDTTMNNPYRVWPIILIVVGMALLLAKQGLITLPSLQTWWPAILIGLGIKWLVWPRKSCRHNRNTQQVQP